MSQAAFSPDLLKNKRILITGGGSGLGKSTAQYFLSLGAMIAICGRREEVLAETKAEFDADYPGQTFAAPCDIRDPEAIESLLDAIWQEMGGLDVLMNNAAGNFVARSEELSHRAMDAILGIVLHGTAYMTTALGKRWLAEGARGNVVSTLTSYAWTGSAYVLPSAMAKAGVLAMTRSLAVEWGGRGIRLNAVAPGPFPTEGAWERLIPNEEINQAWKDKIPLGRFGEHEELTNLMAFLASDISSYINGELVHIDGGEWIGGAGQFNLLKTLSDADWAAMKDRGRSK